MLLQFFRNTKAYVSIFLCLVLLPMVTYSTMIIDASRLQSSRVQVQSAGDLAINAAMSEYDKVLEDMYGLFANATSAEELRPAIRNYFEETISGKINNGTQESGHVADFASKLTDVIMQAKFSTPEEAEAYEKELTNFLQMTIDDAESGDAGFSYDPVLNSAISNPYIMKAQIIDYMKYKGPVSVGNNMLKKIGALKDMKSQSEAVEQKVELTQKIAELGDPMKDAYYAINNPDNPDLKKGYNQFAEQYNIQYSPERLKGMLDNMGSNISAMENMYLWYNYIDVLEEKMDLEKQSNTQPIGPAKDWIAALPDTSAETTASTTTINSKLETIWNHFQNDVFSQSRYGSFDYSTDYDNETGEVTYQTFRFIPDENESEYYATIGNLRNWITELKNYRDTNGFIYETAFLTYCDLKLHWRQFDELGAMINYLSETNRLYQNAVADYEYQLTKDCATQEEKEKVLKEAKKPVNNVQSEYSRIIERKQKIENTNDVIQHSEIKNLYEREIVTAETNLKTRFMLEGDDYKKAINHDFMAFYDVVFNMEERSQFAIDKLTEISKAVDGVSKKAEQTLDNINKNVKDDTARTELSGDIEALAKTVNKEDIEKLIGVLSGYHDRYQTMKLTLEKVTHMENPQYKKLPENYGYDEKYRKAAYNTFGKFVGSSDNANMQEVDFKKIYAELLALYKPTWNGIEAVKDSNDNIKPPFNISAKTITGEPEEEIFYNVLKSTVEAEPAKDTDDGSGKKNIDKLRENSGVSEDGAPTNTPKPSNEGSKSETPAPTESPIPADCVEGAAEAFATAINDIKPGETGGYGTAQSASVPQGKDDANGSAEQGKNALKAANNLLTQIANLGNNIKNNVFLEEYFTELYTCHTDKLLEPGKLKMLNGYTNDPGARRFLNTATPWFGCETEYILWGNSDLNKNFDTTKNTIFLLRFVINAIYAFTASDIQAMASSLATLLVGWTVVLVPVVQVCIILACAVAESAMDVAELVDGKDVPLIKDQATFRCSPSGAINSAIDFAVDKTLEYTEKELNKGISKLEEKAKDGVDNCSKEIDEVVDEYMKNTTENVKASLKTNITIPLITSITPALNKINATKDNVESVLNDAFDQGVQSIQNTINGMDGMMKELTQELLNRVIERKNSFVSELCQKVKDVTKLEDLSAGSIQSLLDSKVDGCVQAISGTIKSKLDTVRNNVTSAIKEKISQGTESVRDAVNSTLTDAGETLKSNAKDFVKENLTDIVDVKQNAKSPAARITMNYKEYCKLFVFIGMAMPGNQEKMIKRASVLMQVNVQYAVNGGSPVTSAGKKDFKMTQAYTLFHVHANVQMKTLFPWAVKIEEDDTNMNAAIDLSHVGKNYINLNYNGVAGY